MSDPAGDSNSSQLPDDTYITFNVKSSSDAKYTLTVPDTITILDLKNKLATSEYADLPVERQRLIYSGRVLKDPDTLASIKIKDGHTIHLVKGAASNARQNTAGQASGSSTPRPAASVPTNIAAGTGNNPLAGLTGARYAGFHGLPGADMFGPDGGMGPLLDEDQLLRMMENPMFLSQMNEAMNNPMVIEQMRNNPLVRNNPMAQQMFENPELRRLMFDPAMIRAQLQMRRAMGGMGGSSFPAPGVTDNTPQAQAQNQNQGTTQGAQQAPPNPFAIPPPFWGVPTPQQPASQTTSQQPSTPPQPSTTSSTSPPPNPFAALFGAPPQASDTTPSQQPDPFSQMFQAMAQNPEAMRAASTMAAGLMGGGATSPPAGSGTGASGNTGNTGSPAAANPFAGLFNPFANPFANPYGAASPPPPPDNRPPEERYAEQLRQLNEMGFYEFERNVQALRRSGGSVQGAVEYLLSNP